MPAIKSVRILTLILIISLQGFFTGCKKSDNRMEPVCQIISANLVGTGNTYHFSYNSNKQLSRIVLGASIVTYSYSGNSYTVVNLDSGRFMSRQIVTTNASGLATNVRTETVEDGSVWFNEAFEYNGDELSKSTVTSSSGVTPAVSTFTWADHNLVSETSNGTTTSPFTFYTDQPRQTGDFLEFLQTVQHYELYHCKNLVKSVVGLDISYETGPDGKIASVEANSGSTTTFLDYGYQCF